MGSRLEKNSNEVRKRIAEHAFDGEDGEEYSASKFGGFRDYMRRKKIKLQNLDAQIRSESDNLPIFRNIVACVNGYTQPSLNDLHTLIVSHGGGFQQYLDGKTTVTHIIASQLTPKKKVEFAKYRVVKPAWVVDSIKAGHVLPWEQYRVLDEGVNQKVLGLNNGQVVTQTSELKQSYRDQSETSWYTSQVKDVADKLNARDQSDSFDASQSFERSLDDEDLLTAEAALHVEERANESPGIAKIDSESVAKASDTVVAGPIAHISSPAKQEKRQLTAEEHNAILLQNPHMAKSSTANPDFLNQYYRESRLHHLSTWKAELKAQLQARAQASSQQRVKSKRPAGSRRYIMHVDFDSFFAAVSLRKNPQLADKAVVVAHGSGPGSEIASCNYPARQFGVKNGMWMKTALELCPDLKVLPYDYPAYEEASKHFYDSILGVDGVVQSISIDEALIDVSDLCINAGGSDGRVISESSVYREQDKAGAIALSIREAVREKTGCAVSVGIGGNILLAKVALRKAKPAGQHLIKPDEILDFIGELLVTDLPGVAHSIGKKLEEISVKYVRDIRALTKEKLVITLGPKTGEKLWDYSRGIDKQEVGETVIRKSVSAEINWGIRFTNQQQAEEFVHSLCEELSKRLLEQLVKGRQLTMKIMRKAADAGMDPPKNLGHGKCDTFNKSIVLGVATNDKTLLGKEAVSILRSYGFPPGELRGLGVQMQKLEVMKPAGSSISPAVGSSQRRLQFKKPDAVGKRPEIQSPSPASAFKRQSVSSTPMPMFTPRASTKVKQMTDPIDDVNLPEKPDSLAASNDLSLLEDVSHAPLNISGTQFMLPSQIDPTVLAELPADIRSRLAPKTSKMFDRFPKAGTPEADVRSRSNSPFIGDENMFMPNQSQLDPETLAALPDDVREEVLAQYKNSGTTAIHKEQQLLPQSPRKARPAMSKKLSTTPKKKNKFTSLLTKGKSHDKSLAGSALVQSNFLSLSAYSKDASAAQELAHEEISADVLAELPEEIRLELLEEQRRQRQQKAGIGVAKPKRTKPKETLLRPVKIGTSHARPKPTFTSRKLSTMPELREAMSAWVQTCSTEEETPCIEDAQSLAVYLKQVVKDELDMAKAKGVVDWLIYVTEDWPFAQESVREAWRGIITYLKTELQSVVLTRSKHRLHFGK